MLLAHSSGLPAHRKLYLASQPDASQCLWQRDELGCWRRLRWSALRVQRYWFHHSGRAAGEDCGRAAGLRFCEREVFPRLRISDYEVMRRILIRLEGSSSDRE